MEKKQLSVLSMVVMLITGCTNGLQPLNITAGQQVQVYSTINKVFPGQIAEIDIKHSDDLNVPGSIYHVVFGNKRGGEDFIGLNLDMEKTSTRVIRNYGTANAEVYYLDKEGRPVRDIIRDLENAYKELNTLKPSSAADKAKLDEMASVFEIYIDTLKSVESLNGAATLRNSKVKVSNIFRKS